MADSSLDRPFKDWIGRRIVRTDVITARLVAEFRAVLAPHIGGEDEIPPGFFWCLAPVIVDAGQLGADGHPRLGLFTPEIGLPRRMWAGGEVTSHGKFVVGDEVTKDSVIEDITLKSGKSGRLCFITARNEYSARNRLVVSERQDIVYCEVTRTSAAQAPETAPPVPPESQWTVAADAAMLFRYSAVIFNGHRIHYDFPFATQVEGYAGLVVHGPLQATLMLNLATQRLGRTPERFSYRGLAPLICGAPFTVAAVPSGGGLDTRVVSAAGVVTMKGTATI